MEGEHDMKWLMGLFGLARWRVVWSTPADPRSTNHRVRDINYRDCWSRDVRLAVARVRRDMPGDARVEEVFPC